MSLGTVGHSSALLAAHPAKAGRVRLGLLRPATKVCEYQGRSE